MSTLPQSGLLGGLVRRPADALLLEAAASGRSTLTVLPA
jgi:hypothetical protein